MCQSSNSFSGGDNDYSLERANTGMNTISVADPTLIGNSALPVLIAAGTNGTKVRSVIIKALAPVTTGMVRLFVQSSGGGLTLYKEVPIPESPTLSATPTPAPALPNFEMTLQGDLMLPNNYGLFASTNLSQSYNIIADGIDYSYPDETPAVCCNFKQTKYVMGQNGNVDTSTDTVFIAPPALNSRGSIIKRITIKALQSTTDNGMLRLYLSSDSGITDFLFKEIVVPRTDQSAFVPSYKEVIDMDFYLAPGFWLRAATTLVNTAFAVTVEATSWTYPT